MAKLYVKYSSPDPDTQGGTVQLDNVIDAGIANDFLVVRYANGVVTFTKTDKIDDAQFDPTEDETTDNVQGESDTADVKVENDTTG